MRLEWDCRMLLRSNAQGGPLEVVGLLRERAGE